MELINRKKLFWDNVESFSFKEKLSYHEILNLYNQFVDVYIKPDMGHLITNFPTLAWKSDLNPNNKKNSTRLGCYFPKWNIIYLNKAVFNELYTRYKEKCINIPAALIAFLQLLPTVSHEHRHVLQNQYNYFDNMLKNQMKKKEINEMLGDKANEIIYSFNNGTSISNLNLAYLSFLSNIFEEYEKYIKEKNPDKIKAIEYFSYSIYFFLEDEVDARKYEKNIAVQCIKDMTNIYGKNSRLQKAAEKIFFNVIENEDEIEKERKGEYQLFQSAKDQIDYNSFIDYASFFITNDLYNEDKNSKNALDVLSTKQQVFAMVLNDKLSKSTEEEKNKIIASLNLLFINFGNVWGIKTLNNMAKIHNVCHEQIHYQNLEYMLDNNELLPPVSFIIEDNITLNQRLNIFEKVMDKNKFEYARGITHFAEQNLEFDSIILSKVHDKLTLLKQKYLNNTLEYDDIETLQNIVLTIAEKNEGVSSEIIDYTDYLTDEFEKLGYLQACKLRENLPPEEIVQYNYVHEDYDSRKQYLYKGKNKIEQIHRDYGESASDWYKAHSQELGD